MAGQPHAEVNAFEDAKRRKHSAQGATLYVTLEPCSTHGRTPPCVDRIIREKVSRVVIAATDPNPRHAGRAFRILKKVGISVTAGVLADEVNELNRAFNRWITTGFPWVTAKIALGLDGKIETWPTETRWLSGTRGRMLAHELRWESDAIVVGGETARRDNPRLTIRLPRRTGIKQPWRVIWSKSGKLPPHLHLLSDAHCDKTLVFKNKKISAMLKDLGKRQVTSVLLEGGGQLLGAAFEAGLVDEAIFILTPHVMGTQSQAVQLKSSSKPIRLDRVSYQQLGQDIICRGLVRK